MAHRGCRAVPRELQCRRCRAAVVGVDLSAAVAVQPWLPRRTSRASVPTMPSRRQPRRCTSKKKPQRLTGGRCDRGGRASPHLLRGAASPHAARPRRRSQTNPNAAGRLARSAATRCEQKGEEEWLGFSRWDGRRAGFVARAYHRCRRIGDRWPMAEQADVGAGEPE